METLFAQYPWLAIIGPLVGTILAFIKRANQLHGFMLLIVSTLISTLVVVCYGYGEIWTPDEWRRVPFSILLMVASSNLFGSTVETTVERVKGEVWERREEIFMGDNAEI